VVKKRIDRGLLRSRYQRIEAQLSDTKNRSNQMKGVNKAFEKRLNLAGNISFEAMAALTQFENLIIELYQGMILEVVCEPFCTPFITNSIL
jgi:hypothetical protein